MSENFDFDGQLQGEKKAMKQEKFELVSAYLDGEVTASQRREVENLLATDTVTRHLYQRLLQLRSEFQRIPIPPTTEPVEVTVDKVFEKIDRRSKRTFVWAGGAIAAVCVAVVSGIVSATRSPMIQIAEGEPVQIALNEPVMEIVSPNSNNLMLTINEPIIQIPEATVIP
ncbi:MAG: transcriptional regulator [Microcoleaceae cyanobacterium MO_207.B10]|nr:transcriptional regulator [Microcoleaceae cyanobacterium MO_207.B10]